MFSKKDKDDAKASDFPLYREMMELGVMDDDRVSSNTKSASASIKNGLIGLATVILNQNQNENNGYSFHIKPMEFEMYNSNAARKVHTQEIKKPVKKESGEVIEIGSNEDFELVLHAPVKKKETHGPIRSNYLRKRKIR